MKFVTINRIILNSGGFLGLVMDKLCKMYTLFAIELFQLAIKCARPQAELI